MKYVFPAILTPCEEEYQGYYVNFPDIPNCFTDGNDLANAVYMAEDALNGMLMSMEDRKDPIPTPTPINEIEHTPEQIVTLIYADTIRYRKLNNSRSVTCAVTLPAWLKTMALDNDINLSQTLKEALKEKLGLIE
jgi:predicted RNase H-like HicB family nuclease